MSHHLNTCAQCRDWGHLERHEDHWPTRKAKLSTEPEADRGHCDTCGAGCDAKTGQCSRDASHEVAIPWSPA